MAESRTLKLSILADVDQLRRGLNQADQEVAGFGEKLGKWSKIAGAAFAAAGVAAGAMASKLAVDAIKAASDLNETVSKTNVIFGESASKIVKFAETAGTSFGQTKQQALDAASTFATFGKSAGLAGDDLVNFSTQFVGLASDLASFNNTTPDEAIQAIGAALRGESEPLRKYGVLLDDATLRAKAMEMGIYNGSGALTAQQKVLAAQQVILEQTKDAQGDFARTSDGLANSQRILTAQIENMKVELGERLLPVVTQVFAFIGSTALPLVDSWADKFNQNLGPALEKLVKFVETQLLPILQAWWGFLADVVIPGIVKTFGPVLEGLTRAFVTVTSKIRENEESLKPLFNLLKTIVTFVLEKVTPTIGTILGKAFEFLGKTIGGVVSILGTLINLFNTAITKVKELATAIANSPIGQGVGAVLDFALPGRASGGPVSAGSPYVVGEKGPEVFVPRTSGTIIPNGAGGSTTNIYVSGAIDPAGVARQIADLLNREATNSGTFSNLGISRSYA